VLLGSSPRLWRLTLRAELMGVCGTLSLLTFALAWRIVWPTSTWLVVDADDYVDVFLNGNFVLPDISATLIPLNGVRRVLAEEVTAKVIVFPLGINPGDLLAVRVLTSRPQLVNVTDPVGKVTQFPAPPGIIMAAQNGVMTSMAFKCSIEEKARDEQRTPFFYPDFNDSHWPAASEQQEGCCPWRDPFDIWGRLNAKWIGLNPTTFVNISGPRNFNCRYRIPGDAPPSNLPAAEVARASTDVPTLNVSAVELSTSVTKMTITVDRNADAYCGIIDARYQLRSPTHSELKRWGSGLLDLAGEMYVFYLIDGVEFTSRELDAPVLYRLSVEDEEGCEAQCLLYDECVALEYYSAGIHTQTGTNCKLINGTYNSSFRQDPSLLASFIQKYRVLIRPPHTVTVSGLLFPATVYNVYCSVEDPATGNHSTWTMISTQVFSERSEGCFDCGNTLPPSIYVRGGWAGTETIGVVVGASATGRLFCSAFMQNASFPPTISPATVRGANYFGILTSTSNSIAITIANLQPTTPHIVACMAESDTGAESTQSQVDLTRREISTEEVPVTISSMRITREAELLGDTISVTTQLIDVGYLWCGNFLSANAREFGVPAAAVLQETAARTKVITIQDVSAVSFLELDRNTSYEVWCTAEFNDFQNDEGGQELLVPFPISTVMSITTSYYTAAILVRLSKGPADVYCEAIPWALRPTTQRPAQPSRAQLMASPYQTTYFEAEPGGLVSITILELTPGRNYDVYCYSETYLPPSETGVDTAPRFGMDAESILNTRTRFIAEGPFFDDLGWSCVSGYTCNVTGLLGQRLTAEDGLLVRADGCPERCRCNGVADPLSKGAMCSEISQDPTVQAGVGIADARDPLGAWCYVDPGLCDDEMASAVFPNLVISYKVCTYRMQAGTGPGVPGFPNGGLARNLLDGAAFSFGEDLVIAFGATYDLCWCNGTETSCTTEADFSVRIGPLHFSGPTVHQSEREVRCIAGLPCHVPNFQGQAIEEGSRLVVLPDDPAGCRWQRASLADPPGLLDFPNSGVSDPYDKDRRQYDFMGVPLIAPGGRYNLCWCGPRAVGTILVPGKDYRQPDGIIPPPCPPVRDEDGGKFLSPAGHLIVVGPRGQEDSLCRLGVDCIIPQILGTGLQGGDRVLALKVCGEAAHPPAGWRQGAEMLGPPWMNAGWMTHGPALSELMLTEFGAPGAPNRPGMNDTNRGVYGFPNFGMSRPSSKVGYADWGGPTWSFSGTYLLCWCGADSTLQGCHSPEDFLVPIGRLIISGPAVLPLAGQRYRCVRMRQCEIENFQGTMPPASQLAVASGECGTESPVGMPRYGQSIPSADGSHFAWGQERVTASPGVYRLCWCSEGQNCILPTHFMAYAGILQVKWPTFSPDLFFCELGRLCNISGVQGEGLSNNDKVMLLTKCGQGLEEATTFMEGSMSIATYEDGGKFLLPASVQSGTYLVCWCAAENTCQYPRDFTVRLGRLELGGPVPDFVYRCFEWQPCEIRDMEGTTLQDGDRLLAVPDGTDCKAASLTPKTGFPRNGVTLPATNGGRTFSWGQGLMRAAPGHYMLCWCGNVTAGSCGEDGPFTVPAGVIRVATGREFQFVNRPEENPERSWDSELSLLLAVPLPALFFGAVCLGVSRIRGRRQVRDEPEAPPVDMSRPNPKVDEARMKSMLALDAKEVADSRNDIGKLLEKSRQHVDQKHSLLALYGLYRQNDEATNEKAKAQKKAERAAAPKPKKLERQGTGLSRSSANSSYPSSTGIRSEVSEFSLRSSANSKQPTSQVPLPPRLNASDFRTPAIAAAAGLDLSVEDA